MKSQGVTCALHKISVTFWPETPLPSSWDWVPTLPSSSLQHPELPAQRRYSCDALRKGGTLCTCQRSSSPKPVEHFPCWLQFNGWGDPRVTALPVWLLPGPLAQQLPELAYGLWYCSTAPSNSHAAGRGPWSPVFKLQYIFQHIHTGTCNANTQCVSIFSLMLLRKLNHSKTHWD